MTDNQLTRLCGLLYLLLIISGVFGLMVIPSQLVDWQNPAATVANIQQQEGLFRLGLGLGLVCYTLFLLLGLALCHLFRDVASWLTRALLAFVLVGTVIGFLTMVSNMNVLVMLSGESYLQSMPAAVLEAQVMAQLASVGAIYKMGNIFWGLWLLPFGLLILRSRLLPGFLGVLLVLACCDYLLQFVMKVVLDVTDIPSFLSLPSMVGEFGVCLWMLLAGTWGAQRRQAPALTGEL